MIQAFPRALGCGLRHLRQSATSSCVKKAALLDVIQNPCRAH
jgi:hypothetical protein